MVGNTYNVPPAPPDPASTDYFDAGPIRVGIEYRKVDPAALAEIYNDNHAHMAEIEEKSPEGGFTDEGISIHIVDVAEDHEYLRFDVFVDEPHYHYNNKVTGGNTVVDFDTVTHGEMMPWALSVLRSRLVDMLRHAGAVELAGKVEPGAGEQIAAIVEEHLDTIGLWPERSTP